MVKVRYDDWESRKAYQSEHQQAISKAGRDIGSLPEVKNPKKKKKCRSNFRLFCETYLEHSFPLKWSDDHLLVISKIEAAVLRGELFAMAMPRGSGKTTLCEAGAMWAVLYAHRSFVTIIGADEPSACQMLESVTTELETNEKLLDDFPEVCFPISKLEGIHHRAPGQLCGGKRTNMKWSAKRVVFPTVHDDILGDYYPTSGAILDVAGITGRLRGRKHKRDDGVSIRPDLVLIDDPQTDEVARSPAQVNERLKILNGAVLGLAGPGKKIAGLCTVTVIAPDDMADCLLDSSKYPQWKGERTKLVYAFPTNMKLWDEYNEIRLQDLTRDDGISQATKFYADNRAAMDEGSKVAWPERKNSDELSALQHAMNLRYQNEASFLAEYQNDPLPVVDTMAGDLSLESLRTIQNGLTECIAMLDSQLLTFGIDVHKECLFYSGLALSDDLTGSVIKYGTFPQQNRSYFTLRDVKITLSSLYPNRTVEEQIQLGLRDLVDYLLGLKIFREDKSQLHTSLIMVDSGYESEAIYDFCRRSQHANVLQAYKGLGIGAAARPMEEYPVKKGDKVGLNWRIPAHPAGVKTGVRLCLGDANHWKSKLSRSLTKSVHERGSISVYGSKSAQHDLLFDHYCSEYKVKTKGRGREVEEWKLKPGRPDNHLWDTTYMALVAASVKGGGVITPFKKEVKKVQSFAELQRQAREKRMQKSH